MKEKFFKDQGEGEKITITNETEIVTERMIVVADVDVAVVVASLLRSVCDDSVNFFGK